MPDSKQTGSELPQRLREARRASSLTMAELAERADVSASLISQIETGRSNGSYQSLRSIAHALEVPLSSLVSDESSDGGPVRRGSTTDRVSVVRANRRKRLGFPESTIMFELLSPDMRGSLEVIWSEVRHQDSLGEPMAHGGEECSIVLRGRVKWTVGTAQHTLEAGDAITFDASIPHQFQSLDEAEPAVMISAMTPPTF